MALLPGETRVHTAGLRCLWDDETDTRRLNHTAAEQRGEDHKDCCSASVSHPPPAHTIIQTSHWLLFV